jgi:hypothetical protein
MVSKHNSNSNNLYSLTPHLLIISHCARSWASVRITFMAGDTSIGRLLASYNPSATSELMKPIIGICWTTGQCVRPVSYVSNLGKFGHHQHHSA